MIDTEVNALGYEQEKRARTPRSGDKKFRRV